MQTTANLGLKKPEGTDVVNVQDFNDNADLLDIALDTKAPLASPALTGTPTAPTAVVDTSTTQVATTAFVLGQAGTTAPAMNGTAGVGISKRYARADHVHPVDTSRAGQKDFAAHLADTNHGTGSFSGGGNETVIPHGLGLTPSVYYVTPTENPNGFLGESWIRANDTNLYVGNSGSFTGAFLWIAKK